MERKIGYDTGQEIETGYDARRCIHTAECIHSLPDVFDRERRPRIQPDGALPTAIAAGIDRSSSRQQARVTSDLLNR